ncbi:MAG: hypothetical protein AAGH99_10985 [Planctomycetota bacterium]
MTNIYVGNLPYDVQEGEVVEYFKQWGPVERATLVFDRETGRPRGFGFVEMDDDTAATQAIAEAHGREFRGRPLTVNQARPRGSGRTSNRPASGFAPPHNNTDPGSSTNGTPHCGAYPETPSDPPLAAEGKSDAPEETPAQSKGYSNRIYS